MKEILEEVHGKNAVVHMLTGKAYSRAIRGNFMIDYCLTNMLIELIDDFAFTDDIGVLFENR